MKKRSRVGEAVLHRVRNSTNFLQSGSIDVIFVSAVLILLAFGLIMMYSASYAYAAAYFNNAHHFFNKQVLYAGIGLLLMYILSKVDYKVYNGRFAPLAFLLTMAILFITLAVNIGESEKRWIKLPGFQFQPSDFAKVSLILILAYLLCIFQKPLRAPKDMMARVNVKADGLTKFECRLANFGTTPFKACIVISSLIVIYCVMIFLESHYSCTILMFAIGVCMLWLSGTRRKYFLYLFLGIAAVIMVVLMSQPLRDALSGFAGERISAWLSRDNTSSERYQTVNGLYAIGSGGFFGVGLGNSVQKQLYIPEPQNDFIFPILYEELGFLGAVMMILLFAILIWRGFVIAKRCRDYFGSLVVMGVMIQIALQVIINICVVTDIFPNTGMALPFFSYGGSSIIALLCEIGIVMSVSRDASMEKE